MPQLRNRYIVWLLLLTVILVTAAIRIRLLDIPLERDEGEYAYAGQLMLHGVPPYAQAYNMKMPGIYTAYALIMAVFGQSITAIHLGLLIVNAITIFLVFILSKKLFDSTAGLVAAAAFAMLSLGTQVFGFSANSEHFVIVFALGGIILLLLSIDSQKWYSLFFAALLLGLCFLMKQHGAAFIVFAGLYLLFYELGRLKCGGFAWKTFVGSGVLFTFGVLAPFAVMCLILWHCGVFEKFCFWTFDYARGYAAFKPLAVGLKNLTTVGTKVSSSAISIWILAGIGMVGLLLQKNIRSSISGRFVVGFLLFSFLAVCPGFYFREHYFILLLPALALLAGIGAVSIFNLFFHSRLFLISKIMPVVVILAALFYAAYQQREYLFLKTSAEISRMAFAANPFPESIEIARYIKEHSNKTDRIAVVGSEPQICFYADRRSATSIPIL
jgi:4-amino-4-deoxy-L-arabinose transferase-like glycosyltransferase